MLLPPSHPSTPPQPATHHSPKRKRTSDSHSLDPASQAYYLANGFTSNGFTGGKMTEEGRHMQKEADAMIPETPLDSPRSKVAERFEGLEIRGQPLVYRGKEVESVKRRRGGDEQRMDMSVDDAVDRKRLNGKRTGWQRVDSMQKEDEVDETPRPQASPPPRPATISPIVLLDSSPPSSSSTLLSDLDHVDLDSIDYGTTLTSYERPSLPQSALTWQDGEITGHLIDTTTDSDDGEGINGVGFRPTPGEAWARSRRRKLQIQEWKAREAREERRRRVERRRGKQEEGVARKERVVRFAEE